MICYMERKFADGIKVTNVKIGRFSWIKGFLKVEEEGRNVGQRHLRLEEKAREI